MFFKKHEGHNKKRGGGIVGIVRLFLSLIIFVILAFGLLQAYRSFSGYDPLKINPKSFAKDALTSESAYEFLTKFLTFNPASSLDGAKKALTDGESIETKSNAPVKFKFAVIADSHKDTANLNLALKQAKEEGAQFIVGLGDFSDVGTEEELENTKIQFEAIGLPYYLTPGDHDLWDSRNKDLAASQNFNQTFGSPYQSLSFGGARILMVFNTDNYYGLDGLELKWLEDELSRIQTEGPNPVFAFLATPIYHPSSDHVMGKVTPKLKDQAAHLSSILQKGGVDEVFSADTHFFSRYKDPATDLKITTVGAVTRDRNPQTPRFAIVDVLEDGSYNISEVEVK